MHSAIKLTSLEREHYLRTMLQHTLIDLMEKSMVNHSVCVHSSCYWKLMYTIRKINRLNSQFNSINSMQKLKPCNINTYHKQRVSTQMEIVEKTECTPTSSTYFYSFCTLLETEKKTKQ